MLTDIFRFRPSFGFIHWFRVAVVSFVVFSEDPDGFKRRRRRRPESVREVAVAERARRERAAGDGLRQEDRLLPVQIGTGHGQLLEGQARHKPLDERWVHGWRIY